jgi:hypothetical protein
VKCGLNNEDDDYKGIEHYNPDCVYTCVENFLYKEVEIIRPKVVFCFGTKVTQALEDYYPEDFTFNIVTLPHPAAGRRGFRNQFFRHLYFSMILEGLYNSGIFTLEEAEKKYGEFLKLAIKPLEQYLPDMPPQ